MECGAPSAALTVEPVSRMGTATAVMPTTVLMIEKTEMIRALHAQQLSNHPTLLKSFRGTPQT
jgi:hypothetical protein